MALSRARTLLIGRLRRRRSREREGLFLAEGVRCAATVLQAGAPVRFAVVSPALTEGAGTAALRQALASRQVERVEISDVELAGLADTESPQGVLLVCEQPRAGLGELRLRATSRLLVLDAVQDPGNVGTLVRVAAAFALDAVVALDGTADPWGAKAVRASAGTVCSLPVVPASSVELLTALRAIGLPLLATTAAGADIESARSLPGWALAVGNEGAGIRADLLAGADRQVAIPMPGDIDSLNVAVAGALSLYALRSGAGKARGKT